MIDNYKGIYYGDSDEQQFYEGGAHFKYSSLCKEIEKLSLQRLPLQMNGQHEFSVNMQSRSRNHHSQTRIINIEQLNTHVDNKIPTLAKISIKESIKWMGWNHHKIDTCDKYVRNKSMTGRDDKDRVNELRLCPNKSRSNNNLKDITIIKEKSDSGKKVASMSMTKTTMANTRNGKKSNNEKHGIFGNNFALSQNNNNTKKLSTNRKEVYKKIPIYKNRHTSLEDRNKEKAINKTKKSIDKNGMGRNESNSTKTNNSLNKKRESKAQKAVDYSLKVKRYNMCNSANKSGINKDNTNGSISKSKNIHPIKKKKESKCLKRETNINKDKTTSKYRCKYSYDPHKHKKVESSKTGRKPDKSKSKSHSRNKIINWYCNGNNANSYKAKSRNANNKDTERSVNIDDKGKINGILKAYKIARWVRTTNNQAINQCKTRNYFELNSQMNTINYRDLFIRRSQFDKYKQKNTQKNCNAGHDNS